MKYKWILAVLILTAIAGPGLAKVKAKAQAQTNLRKVQVVFEGEAKKTVHAVSLSGDEYFSLRDVAQAYGSNLVYHPVTGKVALEMNNRRIDIFVKSTKIFLDGQKKRLNLPSRVVSGELFVPASFVLSNDFSRFSGSVSQYNPNSSILTINRKTNISAPRFYSTPDSTQIIIELGEGQTYDLKRKKQGVLSLSIPKGRLTEDKIEVGDGIVKEFETKNVGRQAEINIFLEPGAGAAVTKYDEASRKLVITVPGAAAAEKTALTVVPQDVAASLGTLPEAGISSSTAAQAGQIETSGPAAGAVVPAAAVPDVVVPAAPSQPSAPIRKKLIILDAGHGGDDPGAVGPNGTKEKDVNLAIVLELKKIFEEDGEYNVLLSRTTDVFIPLVERTSFANDNHADMFISVHSNANMDKDVKGFEIYFLSENASDSDAAATAVLENSVVRLEGSPNKKRAKLQELLWSMTVNEFMNQSAELCSMIGSEVTRRTKIENRGVKQAGFFVLKGAIMPAVLVECAFLSNYGEEAKLRTKKFQSNIADAIFEGIKKYDWRRENANAKK